MKAIRVHKFGDPNVMQLAEVSDLDLKANQILIDIKAVGVNPVDTYIRAGTHYRPQLPFTPGMDAAGVVASIGSEIRSCNVGDHVYVAGTMSGAYAHKTLCHESQVHPLPGSISFEQGAALGIPYATAYRALFIKTQAKKGETVLIHGASGGVGTAAIQFAKSLGMNIIATAGSQKGRELVASQGADDVLNHNDENYLQHVKDITDGRGVDIILEMLSNVNLGYDLTVLARGGRVVVIGCRGNATINPRDMMSLETSVIGLTILSATKDETERTHSAIAQGLKDNTICPIIGQTFSLENAPQAHEEVLKPGAYGKIVLIP